MYVRLKHTLSGLALSLIRRRGQARLASALRAYAGTSQRGEAVPLEELAGRAGLTSREVRRLLLRTGLFTTADGDHALSLAAPFRPVAPYFYRQVSRLADALRLVESPRPPAVSPLVWRAAAIFNAGLFFECHEYLEDAWRAATEPDRTFYHGLVQAAAGCYHLEKGNLHGARTLIGKALAKLRSYAPAYRGIDVAALTDALGDLLGALAADPPRLPAGRGGLPMMRFACDTARSSGASPAPRVGRPARGA